MDKINVLGGIVTLGGDIVPYNPCRCGSGLPWFPLYDAHGVYCQSVYQDYEKAVKGKYKTKIFTDPNYNCNENLDNY